MAEQPIHNRHPNYNYGGAYHHSNSQHHAQRTHPSAQHSSQGQHPYLHPQAHHPAYHQPEEEERILIIGRTTRLGFIFNYLVFLVCMAGAYVSRTKVLVNESTSSFLVFTLLIVGIFVLIYAEVKIRIKKIILSTKRAIIIEGIISRNATTIRYSSITEVVLNQNVLARLLGFGDLTIHTAGMKKNELRMEKAGNARKLKDVIDSLMHKGHGFG